MGSTQCLYEVKHQTLYQNQLNVKINRNVGDIMTSSVIKSDFVSVVIELNWRLRPIIWQSIKSDNSFSIVSTYSKKLRFHINWAEFYPAKVESPTTKRIMHLRWHTSCSYDMDYHQCVPTFRNNDFQSDNGFFATDKWKQLTQRSVKHGILQPYVTTYNTDESR